MATLNSNFQASVEVRYGEEANKETDLVVKNIGSSEARTEAFGVKYAGVNDDEQPISNRISIKNRVTRHGDPVELVPANVHPGIEHLKGEESNEDEEPVVSFWHDFCFKIWYLVSDIFEILVPRLQIHK